METTLLSAPNGAAELPPPIPVDAPPAPPRPRSARDFLDRGQDRAQDRAAGGSPDGQFTVRVPSWDAPDQEATVVLRRLSFAQVVKAGEAGDPILATRLMLKASLVDPPFTAGEVDELMDDPEQAPAAFTLNAAVMAINKTSIAAQAATAATFRAD